MKIRKVVLGYIAGVVSGAFLHICFANFMERPYSAGGEILIIPLMILLVVLGVEISEDIYYLKDKNRG